MPDKASRDGTQGQVSTGHHSYGGQSNPTRKTGRDDGTRGGNRQGHVPGPGSGGIAKPKGSEPAKETQGSTGFEQGQAKNTKDSGGHVMNVSQETIKEI
jgi:hypothetical protein